MEDIEPRMKKYEECFAYRLLPHQSYIIRIDGRAFHTFTRGMEKPFDLQFVIMMNAIGINLCKEIPEAKIAYLQSDEINILVYNNPLESGWFDNKIAKICSVSASLATAFAMKYKFDYDFKPDKLVSFDARAFNLPTFEIINYFIQRQQDWERNSITMLARKYYSQKQLNGKKKAELHDMIHAAGDNWNDLPIFLKRGRVIEKQPKTIIIPVRPFITTISDSIIMPKQHTITEGVRMKWVVNNEIPIFTENKQYITSNYL